MTIVLVQATITATRFAIEKRPRLRLIRRSRGFDQYTDQYQKISGWTQWTRQLFVPTENGAKSAGKHPIAGLLRPDASSLYCVLRNKNENPIHYTGGKIAYTALIFLLASPGAAVPSGLRPVCRILPFPACSRASVFCFCSPATFSPRWRTPKESSISKHILKKSLVITFSRCGYISVHFGFVCKKPFFRHEAVVQPPILLVEYPGIPPK